MWLGHVLGRGEICGVGLGIILSTQKYLFRTSMSMVAMRGDAWARPVGGADDRGRLMDADGDRIYATAVRVDQRM